MSGFGDEPMDRAVATIMARGWWTDEEKAKFLAADEAPPNPVEKTINDVMDILSKDKASRGAAEQIKSAADQSIKRQTRDGGLNDAIRGR